MAFLQETQVELILSILSMVSPSGLRTARQYSSIHLCNLRIIERILQTRKRKLLRLHGAGLLPHPATAYSQAVRVGDLVFLAGQARRRISFGEDCR